MSWKFNPFTGTLDYYEANTGGGGGSTVDIIHVANYAALPAPSSVSLYDIYIVDNAQGTKWLPGSMGGTYYPSGAYYSDLTKWIYTESAGQASQGEVNAGTVTDKFVTPSTLNNYSGWTKSKVGLSDVDNTSDANKPISSATQTALNLITNINWLGDYNNGYTYTVGDGVMFNGASFRMYNAIGAAGYAPSAYPGNWKQITEYVSPNDIGLGNVDNTSDINKPISTATQNALDLKADLVGGTVPSSQLPSYVDDVIEGYYSAPTFYSNAGLTTPIVPETGKIYVDLLANKSYRWSGSIYIQISNAISSIDELTDVTVSSPLNGQLLQYNTTTSQWENQSITVGTGDMQKSTYDTDNDGIVDFAETVPVTVRNPSVSDILRKGTIVYLNGATGWRPNAYKAQANAEATSSGTFGVVLSDIGTTSDGTIATLGTIHTLNTSNTAPYPFTADILVDGDILWLDPNNAGYVTKTKPQAPNHAVFIGVVARTHPSLGRIVYRITNGYELDELHNVFINGSLANNDILYYDSATLLWKARSITTTLGYTPANINGDTFTGAISATNLSGTNTGDETITTIKSKLGITTLSGSNTGDQDLSGLVIKNTAITGETKTKITYDSKGLVTSGTDATTADIADSTNKRYTTDAQQIILGNTSNTNSGDETTGSIKTKLGAATTALDGYLTSTDWNTFYGKQDALTIGNITDVGTDGISVTGGTGTIIGSGVNISQQAASATQNGYLSSTDWNTFNSAAPVFIPALTATCFPRGYYANNGSATMSVLGNANAATISGTAAAISIANTNTLTRTIRLQVPTTSTAGAKAGIRSVSLYHSVGQGFYFSVGWCIQDAAYVAGAKQFHGFLPITTLGTLSNTVDNSSLLNFIGVGSDAADTNLQVFYNDGVGTASKIDLGVNFPANRTAGAALNNFYVFEMYNAPGTTSVKYRITERSTGNTAQGTLTTDLPLDNVLLGIQAIRTNGASTLATVNQWSHLIAYTI